MINVSNNYKQALTQPRTIDAKITYDSTTINIDNINSIKRSFNSTLFKTIAKQVVIDSNVSIDKDKTINPQFGLYLDNQFEYVSLGSYKTKDAPNLNKDTNSYEITAYDKIVESMVSYELTESDITYPCTVRQLFVAIFTKLGWSTSGIPATFVNSTSQIEEDVYSNVNMTYRDVLDELCTISCMFLIDINGTPTLKQKTTTSETINEDFMGDTNVQIKNQVFFNSLVFSRASNSDNIYRKDDASITTNGLHEFKVSDLQILSLNWRDNFIDAMWNYIKTFTYYAYEINTIGITYLEPIDTFTLSTFGSTYPTILLNSDLTIANGVNEKIYANEPLESETEYKYADTTDKRINQTYLIVDKQQGQINAVVSQVDEIEQELANPTSIKEGEYFDLEDALDQPLIDFSLYGDTQQDGEPTPSTPIPIEVVSGRNTIQWTGKNIEDWSTITYSGGNNAVITRTEATYSLVGGSSQYGVCRFYFNNLNLLPNTTYTLSALVSSTDSSRGARLGTNVSGSVVYGDSVSTGNIAKITFTTPAILNSTYYIGLFIGDSNSTTVYTNIMLERGNTATEYEVYEGYSQEINLGKNLFKISNYSKSGYNITINNPLKGLKAGAYTISCQNKYVTSGKGFASGFSNTVNGAIGDRIDGIYFTAYTFGNTIMANTVTLTQNCCDANYLVIYPQDNQCTEQVLNDMQIMIEKGDKATTYSEYFTPIELNKISTYQDYIYKENDRWFLHKEIEKVVLDGSEDWSYNSRYTFFYTTSFTLTNTNVYTNYYKYYPTITGITGSYGCSVYQNTFRIKNTDYTQPSDLKTWLQSHNTIVYYPLATPTDTEITDTTLLEQLNRLMTLPLYKNMTHITLTPNDLQPTMKIEYYRDTSLNNTFVPKTEMNKYYTKTETIAQIQIGNSSIQQNVAEIQTTLDSNGEAINTISNQVQTLQSSTSLQINAINSQLENGVEKVKTRTGYTFDSNGLGITKGEEFKNLITDRNQQISSNNKEILFMGYDDNLKKTVARIPELESARATIGVHRTEIITRNGQKRTAGFYIGGGN